MYTRPSPSLKLSSFPGFLLHVPPMLPLAMVGYTADISQPAPFFVWPASIWNVIVYWPDFKARTAMRGLSLAENQTAKRGLKTRPHVASTYALPVDASDGELDTCWLHRSSPHYCNGLPCTFFWHIPCHFSHTPRTYAMFRRIPFHQRTQNDTPCFSKHCWQNPIFPAPISVPSSHPIPPSISHPFIHCTSSFRHERTHETHAFPCRHCKRTYRRRKQGRGVHS